MTTPIVKCKECGYEGGIGVEIFGSLCQDCGEKKQKELTQQRNKLSRQISSLKKANLK